MRWQDNIWCCWLGSPIIFPKHFLDVKLAKAFEVVTELYGIALFIRKGGIFCSYHLHFSWKIIILGTLKSFISSLAKCFYEIWENLLKSPWWCWLFLFVICVLALNILSFISLDYQIFCWLSVLFLYCYILIIDSNYNKIKHWRKIKK